MSKLVVLSGVPGSGKSYLTKTVQKVRGSHTYVVSSDDLRTLVCGNQQDMSRDRIIWEMYYELAKVWAIDRKSVVFLDSTNIIKQHRMINVKPLKDLFNEVDLIIFKRDLDIVHNQNLQREWPVPPKVIDDFDRMFEEPDDEEKAFFHKIMYIRDVGDFSPVVAELVKDD